MNPKNKLTLPLALAIFIAGGAIMLAIQSFAQSNNTTTTPPANQAQDKQKDPSQATHVGSNGVREELLTGDNAERARSAGLTAVPGGTVQRVETDAEGSPYEAHMTRSDGSRVTVKFDSNFNVTAIEEGYGRK